MLLHLICFLCALTECTGEDRVIQARGHVTAAAGDTVTLGCRFETMDTNSYLFWYKQEISDFPRFMLRRYKSGAGDNAAEFPKDRFDAQVQNASVPVKIQNVQLSDSAVYYCVLTSSGVKLLFGNGTKLTITSREAQRPSYYKLEASQQTEACLATGFTSHNATEGVAAFDDAAQAARARGDAFYSQVALYPAGKRDCLQGAGGCDDLFNPDEKTNFLSLTVLGLRLLFMKAVAFNTLITLRVWMS